MYNKVDKFKQIVDGMLDLYQRKQADYGDSAAKTFDEYGLVSFLVRMEDKLNRVATLTKKSTTEQQVKDEKIEDTLLDNGSRQQMRVAKGMLEQSYAQLLEEYR